MLFVITATDKPDALERRGQHRPAHLDCLESMAEQVRAAGALLDGNEQPMGSLSIVEAPERTAAEALVDNDPFSRQGVFESVEIRPWRPALGTWIG